MNNRITHKGQELQVPVNKSAAEKRKIAQQKRLAKFYKANPGYVEKYHVK